MPSARPSRFALPLQVAAVCYRRENSHAEFLLVNTNGGSKWTFPKGAPDTRLSHSQAAEREAREEAEAFLMDVRQTRKPHEDYRHPTWFDAEEARVILAKGREVKYAKELQAVIDRALEQIGTVRMVAAR